MTEEQWVDPKPWIIQEPLYGQIYRVAEEPTMAVDAVEYSPRTKEEWLKEERRAAKNWYFGTIYGVGTSAEQRQAAGRLINRAGEIGFAAAQEEARNVQ